MAERYWITGVQMTFLLAAKEEQDRKKILKEVSKQFIGSYPTDADKKRFKEWINTAPNKKKHGVLK